MKFVSPLAAGVVVFLGALHAQNLDQIKKLEAAGDLAGARAGLVAAVERSRTDPVTLRNYAEFLDRYGDPASRQVYNQLLAALRQKGDSASAAVIARRLAALDLLAGDRDSASRRPGTAAHAGRQERDTGNPGLA